MSGRLSATAFPPLTLAQLKAGSSTSPPPPPPPIPTPETLVTLSPPSAKGADDEDSSPLAAPSSEAEEFHQHRHLFLQGHQLHQQDGVDGAGAGAHGDDRDASPGGAGGSLRHPHQRAGAGAGGLGGVGAGAKARKRERWLVTRKTWRYMADAGKLLIPEVLRKGKDLKDYSGEDIVQLDETFQKACDQLQEFVVWEGPLEDPRILLARNRMESGAELIAASLDNLGKQQLEVQEEEEEILGEKKRRGPDRSPSSGSRVSVSDPTAPIHHRQSEREPFHGAVKTPLSGRRGRRQSSSVGSPPPPPAAASAGKGLRPVPQQHQQQHRRSGSAKRRVSSTARMPSFSGFGPGVSSGRSGSTLGLMGASAFDSKLGKVEGERGGFFPSPYGTGMLPQPDYKFSSVSEESSTAATTSSGGSGFHPRLRVMLPVGERPPSGFTQVGRRSLPLGDLPHYTPPNRDSYFQLPGTDILLEELPAAYASDHDREWMSSRRTSSSAADSGLLSPGSQDEMMMMHEHPSSGAGGEDSRSFLERLHHHPLALAGDRTHESGIGSGADSSVGTASLENRKISVTVQTEPMPDEFFRLQEEERRRREEEERLAREAEERARKEEEEMEAAAMGDSVMRYLKMVRRNSKSADHKKADRFRSMNYDPTLRNIKAKYLHSEDLIRGIKHVEIQAGEALVSLLKRCETMVDPTPDSVCSVRKLSQAVSDFSDSIVGSPPRRLSIPLPEEPLVSIADSEKDFFSHLYSGDMPAALEASSVPEDYYHYLESWYRSQKGLQPPLPAVASSASSSVVGPSASITSASTGNIPRTVSTTSISSATSLAAQSLLAQSQQRQQHHAAAGGGGLFIPVSALQNLRASMPSLTSAASTTSNVSRSTSSLGKSQSFLSSVISKPFSGLGTLGASAGGSTGRMLTKKLWRSRSKSQSRPSVAGSLWTPQVGESK